MLAHTGIFLIDCVKRTSEALAFVLQLSDSPMSRRVPSRVRRGYMTSERSQRRSFGTRHGGHTHPDLDPRIDAALVLMDFSDGFSGNQSNYHLRLFIVH